MCGCDGLIRDWEGKVISTFACPLNYYNVLYAELYAIYYGILICNRLNITDIWIEVDPLNAINMIQSTISKKADIFYLHKKIMFILKDCNY